MEEETKQEETQEEAQEPVKDEAQEETSETVKDTAPEAEKEKPLDKMTAKELREIALEIPGISGVHAMKKEELLAEIKEARGIVDEEPAKKKKKISPKKEVNAKELKAKVAKLLEEKRALPSEGNRKKRNVLRRRINRLKKQTRKVA